MEVLIRLHTFFLILVAFLSFVCGNDVELSIVFGKCGAQCLFLKYVGLYA